MQGWLAGELAPAADDPLLFIESVPLAETRGYLKKVLANLWAYQARAGGTAPSLQALAENRWPEVGPAPAPPPPPRPKPSPPRRQRSVPGRIDETIPFQPLRIAVLTVSDTRTAADDRSGDTLAERIAAAGHHLAARAIVRDDRDAIAAQLRLWIADPEVEVVITTGGTGVTGRDVTPEALAAGRREAHRRLRRAVPHAQLPEDRHLLAAVARRRRRRRRHLHLLPARLPRRLPRRLGRDPGFQLDIRHRPCNFAELLPRLREHERQG